MGEARRADVRRTTVAEAAEVLGIGAEAVRGRIRRGTLPVEREGGTVYVILDRRTTADRSQPTDDQPSDRTGASDALISQLRDEIAYLREENRRKGHLLAAALERIPPQIDTVAPENVALCPSLPQAPPLLRTGAESVLGTYQQAVAGAHYLKRYP